MNRPEDRLADALADLYTIEREVGAGGMATVYLAHDKKHGRKVAIKNKLAISDCGNDDWRDGIVD